MKRALLIVMALAGSVMAQPEEGGWQVLESIVSEAPGRQVGQPGNEFVDQWVEQTFQRFVEANGGESAEQYAARQADYHNRLEAMLEARDGIYLEEVSPALLLGDKMQAGAGGRPSFSRSVLRSPTPVYFILTLGLVCVVVAWWFQRRPGLVWLGAGMLAGMAALGVASHLSQKSADLERAEGRLSQASDRFAATAASLLPTETAAGGWQRGRVTTHTAAFIPGEAKLGSESGQLELYQLAPNLVAPANLPGGSLEGPLVYGGDGNFDVLPADQIEGAVVLLEFDSSAQWLSVVELGAKAVIFLEPPAGESTSFFQALSKTSNSPLTIPRFYLPRAGLDDFFGAGWETGGANGLRLQLSQTPGRWERVPIHTDWLIIPGREQTSLEELVHIQAYKDASSIVPALSPGAESAMNLVAVQQLLESWSVNPPVRSVLISVVNDHCNALNGEFAFGAFAFTRPNLLAEELNRIDFLHSQKLLVSKVYSREPTEELLEYLRSSIERVGGRSFTVKEPAVNLLTMRRNNLRGEQNLLDFQLQEGGLKESEQTAARERLAEIRAEVEDLVAMLGLFNRFGHKTTFAGLSDANRLGLRELFAQLGREAALEADLLQAERLNLWQNLELRSLLAPPASEAPVSSLAALLNRGFPEVPTLAAVNLDLGQGSGELGLFFEGQIRPLRNNRTSIAASQRTSRLARLALQVSSSMAEESGEDPLLRDTILGAGGRPWLSHLGTNMAFGSSAFHQFARAGVTLASVADQHPVLFTPDDTLARLDRDRVEKLLRWSNTFLVRLVDEPTLPQTLQTRPQSSPFSAELTVRKMDRFSVEIPRTILPGALVMGVPSMPNELEPRVQVGQVRPFPMLMADLAGRVTLRGELWRDASLFAYGFDETFDRFTAAQDLGDNERRFSSTVAATPRVNFLHRSIVTFECDKVDLLGFASPLTLEPVPRVQVLDARTDNLPRHFSVLGTESSASKRIPQSFDGALSVFVSPGIPFKLRSDTILALNSTPDNIEGIGFASDAGLVRGLPLIMAHDYERLSRVRLDLLASKGVTSDAAEAFATDAAAVLESIPAVADPVVRSILAEVARGLGFQAYSKTVATINDLVKAVIILLALVVPFCFFVVKLISPFTDINRQIMLFLAVFAFFAMLLYFIQPAFAVGDRPEVVILAFVILGLAVFVGSVILGKFDSAMNQAVELSQLSESPEAPQGRLAGVAFMVGVNNMKRRRIRTSLTCATIVLVTFTILSVISISQDAEPLRLRVGAEAPYNGFVYVQPGLGPVSPLRMSRLRAHFGERADTVARSWTLRKDAYGGYLSYYFFPDQPDPSATLQSLPATVILGLETGERNFITNLEAPEYLVPGSRWFSSNSAKEVMLSRRAAEFLGITPENFVGRSLSLNAQSYEVVALFEDDTIAGLQDLRNLPILPLKTEAMSPDAETEATGGDVAEAPGVSVASTMETVFMPLETAQSLGSTTFRALGAKYTPRPGETPEVAAGRVWEDVQRLLRYQESYLAVGLTEAVERGGDRAPLEPGVYALASSSSAALGGTLKVAIPVILAATIILNTMLGSVMERKKEISIYNAIGLNPSHVMMFFLAEALVFGLVGAVAGYFIGQILSVTLGQFMDINLNYSSLSVMVVIFLTISTVMLSTLYPASMAAKAAVPSGQRKWSLPNPEGDEIYLRFPFSYDSRRILAICAYLHDFMQQNSEASTGKFLARLRGVGKVPSRSAAEGQTEPGEALVMIYDITPIPFDLGVNQKMEVYADYDPQVKAYMLSVHLTRESGERHSWTTVNQPFLESLRKRLLAWRSQRHEVQESYFAAGEKLFKDAQELPVIERVG